MLTLSHDEIDMISGGDYASGEKAGEEWGHGTAQALKWIALGIAIAAIL